MPTLLDIKTFVANQLGSTDTSANIKRDSLINQARRQYYNEYKWSFCFKTTSVSLTAQVGDLPTDFNLKYNPIAVYTYTENVKYDYGEVSWDDIDGFTQDSYVYAINPSTKVIKINQTAVSSVTLDYIAIPADAATDSSEDSVEELAPDITAIAYRAIALWWLSSERSTANFDRFSDLYKSQVAQDRKQDSFRQAPKPFDSLRGNYGYNSHNKSFVPRGYVSRY